MTGKLHQSPLFHGAGKRIHENKSAITVMDKLYVAAVHDLVAQNAVSKQRYLVGIEACHRVGSKLTAHKLICVFHKNVDKGIHAFLRCFLQLYVFYFCLFLCHSQIMFFYWSLPYSLLPNK